MHRACAVLAMALAGGCAARSNRVRAEPGAVVSHAATSRLDLARDALLRAGASDVRVIGGAFVAPRSGIALPAPAGGARCRAIVAVAHGRGTQIGTALLAPDGARIAQGHLSELGTFVRTCEAVGAVAMRAGDVGGEVDVLDASGLPDTFVPAVPGVAPPPERPVAARLDVGEDRSRNDPRAQVRRMLDDLVRRGYTVDDPPRESTFDSDLADEYTLRGNRCYVAVAAAGAPAEQIRVRWVDAQNRVAGQSSDEAPEASAAVCPAGAGGRYALLVRSATPAARRSWAIAVVAAPRHRAAGTEPLDRFAAEGDAFAAGRGLVRMRARDHVVVGDAPFCLTIATVAGRCYLADAVARGADRALAVSLVDGSGALLAVSPGTSSARLFHCAERDGEMTFRATSGAFDWALFATPEPTR